MITRRLGLLGGLSLAAVAPAGAAEQPITVMVGAPAGSGADTIGHDFVTCFESHLGSGLVGIRNLPGEAGWTMLSALADAPPTGAAVGWVTTPTLPARMIDRSDPTLARRIRLVGMMEREPVAFVSPVSDPVTSVQDVIQKAGNDADAMPLGTPPAGSPPHLAALRLQALAQARLNIVTFPSAAAAYQAVLAGNVSAAALGLSDVIDGIHDGNLSAIGLAARRRFGVLPDTPVLNEAGIPLAAFIGRGIGVPVGTPDDVVGRLETAMRAVAEDEDFRDQAEARGYHVMWHDGATWVAEMQAEQAELARLWATDPWVSSSGG